MRLCECVYGPLASFGHRHLRLALRAVASEVVSAVGERVGAVLALALGSKLAAGVVADNPALDVVRHVVRAKSTISLVARYRDEREARRLWRLVGTLPMVACRVLGCWRRAVADRSIFLGTGR